MSIVVADLKVAISASGVQETATAVKAVGAEAAQTARALEIMAEAIAKNNKGYGTAADALAMLQRSGAQPTAVALERAAAEAQKTAAAVAATVAPAQAVAKAAQDAVGHTQAVAKASEDVSKGWTASESSVVRFGAGVLGVGLGISLVAGAARLVHDAVVSIADGVLDWERSLVNLSGLYGEVGAKAAAVATAQATLPGVLGSQQEFARAAINASDLRLRYGLPQQTIDQLTTTGGRVAFATGITDEAQRAQLQGQIAAAVRTGAPLPTQYATYTDPEAVARRLGFAGAQSLQAFTPQQLQEARGAIVSEGLNKFADQAEANQRAALAAATNIEKAQEQAQTALQNNLENLRGGPSTEPLAVQARIPSFVRDAYTAAQAAALPTTETAAVQARIPAGVRDIYATTQAPRTAAASADIQGLGAIDAEQKVVQASQRYATALADSAKATEDARRTIENLGKTVEAAGAQLLHFFGSLEDQTSIARGDLLAQAQAAVGARAVGPNPLIYQSPAELAAQARTRAAQDAWQTYVAPLAQQEQTDAVRRNLERQATTQGPGLEAQRAAAQAALDDQTRRTTAENSRLQSQQAGAFAARAQTEAQAQLSELSIRQDERRLSVAVQLAGYQTQALQLEGQLAPIMLQQATLQDRIVVASRDNLASRRELIAAEQQQLAVTQVTSAYDYEQQRLKLRAQQSLGSILSGQGPTEDIGRLQEQYFRTQIQRAASGVDIQALDASRQVQVVGQQRTSEQLARDVTLTNLEAEARALDAQSRPLEANLRAVLAEEQSVQRMLALLNLQDTAAQVAAGHALNAASLLALKAAEAERAAADLAANQNLGATAADRWAQALSRGYQALNDSAVAVASVRDMLLTMPPLVVPTEAGAAANGGARVPGSEFSIPTTFTPFPKYDPARAFDQYPGTPPAAGAATVTTTPAQQPYTTGSLPTNLPLATLPTRPALNPTPDRQDTPQRLVPLPQGNVSQTSGGNALSVSVPLTINGQTPQQIKDAVHQEVEDALNRFFTGASTAGPPAPASVAGNGR